jgi:hypothetical protein
MGVRTGLIGETYKVNNTHLAYCESDKLVPHVWSNGNVPSGKGQYLVFKAMGGSGPEFTSILDSVLYNSNTGHESGLALISKITYFACEAV